MPSGLHLRCNAVAILFAMALAMSCAFDAPAFAEDTAALTPDEVAWRRQHPVVRVGVFAGDHLPAETWVAGHPEGLGPDYARLLAEKVGLRLSFDPFTDWESVSWPDSTQLPRYELLLGQPHTPSRHKRFTFLRPYLTGDRILVARKGDTRIRSGADIARSRLVMERRYRESAEMVAKRYPRAMMLYADDGREALRMVADGEADAYIGNTEYRTRTLLHQRAEDDLVVLGPIDLPTLQVGLAIPVGEPMLERLLRKAEAAVTPEEFRRLQQRWGVEQGPGAKVPASGLSPAERRFLSRLPVLRLGYETNRHPFSFVNQDGEFDGLAAGYLDAIRSKLGLRVELVPAKDWGSLQRAMLSGEVDMVPAAIAGDFPGDQVLFTRPYDRFPEVIVTRLQGPMIAGPEDLRGRRVAAREEAGLQKRLGVVLDQSTLVPVGSNEAGLGMVADGNVDAYIGTLPAIDSLIRDRYAAQLRVAGPAGLDHELAFAVHRQYAPLVPLMDRVLAGLGEKETQALRTRWLTTEYRYGVPWGWVLAIVLGSGVLFAVMAAAHVGMRRQVRARTAAERKLADQLQFQERLLNNIHYPVFVKDTQGRYLAVNLAYTRRYGVEARDLIGRTLLETRHLPQIEAEAIHDFEISVFGNDAQLSKEIHTLPQHAGGKDRYELLWIQMFELGNGEPAGLLGTAVDITEIRTAEERARASELRLAEITRTLPSAVFELRVWPDGRREFTYAGGDTRGTIGLTPEQLVADENLAFSHVYVDDRPLIACNVTAAAVAMQPMQQFDVRMHSCHGLRWIRTAGGPPRHGPHGSVDWSGYWVDVTDSHEQAQALARANSEAKAAVAAKAAFLAMMSHEIRTPMAGVLGLVELLAQTRLNREQAQMLSMAQDSARTLLQILDDILDYSRIESGRLELENAPFELRSLIDGVVGLFTLRAREKGLRLYCTIDWRLAGAFIGDAVRIRQITTNLLSNALKFTPRGHVEVRAELLGESQGRQKLSIAVIDTGIGISDEQFLRLFRPFTQAEASTARRFGGSGLGLTICQRLANLMGGKVGLESTAEVGTRATFEVSLPVASPLQPMAMFAGKTAVTCTQDAMLARELANALSSMGFSVVEAEPSELGALDDDSADLLIVDRELLNADERPSRARLLLLDDAANPHTPAGSGDAVLLGNPLLWSSVRDACQAIFEQATPARVGVAVRSTDRQTARILIAEDHPVNRAVIARQLGHLGYDFVLTADGEQALAALQESSFDLLITDCDMPRMDGYALAARIRSGESDAAPRLPIIALSASAMPEEAQRCKEAGMDGFIAKPVTLDVLERTLALHLDAAIASTMDQADVVGIGVDRAQLPADSQGDADENRRWLLHELLTSCRDDIRELDAALASGEVGHQRSLLHRMKGALALLGEQTQIDAPGSSADPAEQRDELVRRLGSLETTLRTLEESVLAATPAEVPDRPARGTD